MEGDFGDDAFPERPGRALVPAREDGDAATGLLEGAGEDFDDRGFAGTADSEVANADDLAAECVVAENPVVPEPEAELDGGGVDAGQTEEKPAGQARAEIPAAFEDDVENVLLDGFSPLPHGRS